MNSYEFKVELLGRMTLEVIAPNKEEAKRMVKDLIDGISQNEIESKQSNNENIIIKNSEVADRIIEKNKDKERG